MLSLIQNLVQLVLVLCQSPFQALFTHREDEEEMMDEGKQKRTFAIKQRGQSVMIITWPDLFSDVIIYLIQRDSVHESFLTLLHETCRWNVCLDCL